MMNTSIRSGFITDLMIPPDGTCNLSPAQLEELSINTAMSLLHDFPAFIHSNPLVQAVKAIDTSHPRHVPPTTYCKEFELVEPAEERQDVRGDWEHFEITDSLPIMGGALGAKELIYHTAMRRTAHGFEGLTSAGSGVKISGRFEIEKPYDGTPGVIHFIEHGEVKCNRFLGMYIKATLGSSHRNMHENFKKRWTEEMKRVLAEQEQAGVNSHSELKVDRKEATQAVEKGKARTRVAEGLR